MIPVTGDLKLLVVVSEILSADSNGVFSVVVFFLNFCELHFTNSSCFMAVYKLNIVVKKDTSLIRKMSNDFL